MKDVTLSSTVLRLLAFGAGLGNILGNLLVLAWGRPLFHLLGVTQPADGYTFAAMAGLSLTMGVAVVFAARSPERNIDLFKVGVVGKALFVAITGWFHLGGTLHPFWLLIAGFDALCLVLFLLCLTRFQSPDLERFQRGDVLTGLPRRVEPREGNTNGRRLIGTHADTDGRRALVLTFSLSGTGRAAVARLQAGLERAGYAVDVAPVRPIEPVFRFPLSLWAFSRIVVRAMFRVPARIEPLERSADHPYDLVVVEGQTWMVGLSAPIEALFQQPAHQALFLGRDAAALVVCRGAWRRSTAMLVRRLEAAGANVVGARGFGHQGVEPARLFNLWAFLLSKGQGGSRARYGLSEASLAEIEAYGEALGRRAIQLPAPVQLDEERWDGALEAPLHPGGALDLRDRRSRPAA